MRTLCLLLLACATTPPAPEKPPAPAPTARSSVAAVLEHSVDLALSQDQQDTLQHLDDALAEKNDGLRAEASKHHDNPQSDSTQAPMAPRGARGIRGGGAGGSMGHHGGGARANPPESQALRDKLDDNDTQTFFEAEKSLTEVQKPKARELAGKYREELFNYRASRPAQ
jgi:hypothetical protein